MDMSKASERELERRKSRRRCLHEIVRRLAAIGLSAALACGLVPAAALAQAPDANGGEFAPSGCIIVQAADAGELSGEPVVASFGDSYLLSYGSQAEADEAAERLARTCILAAADGAMAAATGDAADAGTTAYAEGSDPFTLAGNVVKEKASEEQAREEAGEAARAAVDAAQAARAEADAAREAATQAEERARTAQEAADAAAQSRDEAEQAADEPHKAVDADQGPGLLFQEGGTPQPQADGDAEAPPAPAGPAEGAEAGGEPADVLADEARAAREEADGLAKAAEAAEAEAAAAEPEEYDVEAHAPPVDERPAEPTPEETATEDE
jgi:hypothetical protein